MLGSLGSTFIPSEKSADSNQVIPVIFRIELRPLHIESVRTGEGGAGHHECEARK